jgi:hypothetical protein
MDRKNTIRLAGGGLLIAALSGLGMRAASADQEDRRLQSALRALRDAQTDLREARGEFGGHREQALDFTVRALRQVERAMEFDHRRERRRERR